MSEITRMVLVLSVIAGVCSAALTSANYLLAPYIDQQTDFYVRGPALARLFDTPADEVLGNKVVIAHGTGEVPVFFMMEDDQVSRLAVEAVGTGGYGGDLLLMIGIDLINNRLTGMETVSHSETPGLGGRIEEEGFRRQWRGLSLDQPVATTTEGGIIDGISGASVTSQAATRGTNAALDFVRDNRELILAEIAGL